MNTTNINSISALVGLPRDQRTREIITVLRRANRPMTDREIAKALGYYDPNSVRPRITEEIQRGESSRIIKVGNIKCELTKKTVRTVYIRTSGEVQGRLF